MNEELKRIIKSIALKNAIDHDGIARLDSVISKLLAIRPDLKPEIKSIMLDIKNIINDVNLLSLDKQREELDILNPDFLIVKREERKGLPPLPNAEMNKVVTRFPPEPNGYPHIGHAKAAILDEEYARMYNGKFILRFDDTNPAKERLEYYDAIIEGLNWLNIKPDLIKNTSDDMRLLYTYAKMLIDKGYAYVCICKQDVIKENRRLSLACKCRSNSIEENLDQWDKMFNKYKENQAVLRFKGDLESKNTTMRDPTLFRIIEHEHPKQGLKYRVWPTYDFAAPIEDSLDGVTHAMRSKEYELRNELYYAILDRLSLRKPLVIEFSRLEFEGMPVSKRIIKPLIEEHKVIGWNDPRLPTLIALKRRGILPEAIREFILTLGFTKADTKPPFDKLEAINRKLLDSIAIRLFFVSNPIKLIINNMPDIKSVIIKNHPEKDLGRREITVSNELFISRDDTNNLKEGMEIRLLELFNIIIDKIDKDTVYATYNGNILKDIPKIQWVSNYLNTKILIPKQLYINEKFNEQSLEIIQGYGEEYIKHLSKGSRVQFVRFGFCILDDNNTFILTHK